MYKPFTKFLGHPSMFVANGTEPGGGGEARRSNQNKEHQQTLAKMVYGHGWLVPQPRKRYPKFFRVKIPTKNI